jgi:hypothetical protein
LFEPPGPFDESMLLHEVTLDEWLVMQYPPVLAERFPEQVQADRHSERCAILAATSPGDTLWVWRWVNWSNVVDGAPFDCGGLALNREGKVIRVWLVWEGY